MKAFLFLAALLVVALAAEDKFTNKYDNVNLDQILNNDRLLQGYFKCLLERGPCTPDGKELKESIPDALTNECRKCTERQKEGSEKVIKYLSVKKPDMWRQLVAKYDPEGKYTKRYSSAAHEHGINV